MKKRQRSCIFRCLFRCLLLTVVVATVVVATAACATEPPFTALAFVPDGKSVVAASQSGLHLFDWPNLKPQQTNQVTAANLRALAFSPSGKQLAIGGGNPSDEGIVEILSWPERKSIAILREHEDSVTSIAWHDESHLLSASLDRRINLYDIESSNLSRSFQGHSRGVTSLCLLRDGKTMVSVGNDQSLRVWDPSSGKLIRSQSQHTKPIHDVALRPAEAGLPMVATAAADRTVRFWQPTIGRMVRYVRLDSEPLCIAWSNDGNRILAACVDGNVRVIDPDEVKVLRVESGIDGWAYTIATHPEDGSVAVGGSDGQLRRIPIDVENK